MRSWRLPFCILLAGLDAAWALEVSALHPRIYVRHDAARVGEGITVAELRERLHQPPFAQWRRDVTGDSAAAIVERAARYLEEGRPADLDAVRDFLLTKTFSYEEHDVGGFLAGAAMATAFDWVHEGLPADARRAAMANIVTTANSSRRFLESGGPDINHNYTYMALWTVAVCGLVLHGEPAPYHQVAIEYLQLAERFVEAPGRVLDTWAAREGAWAEGSHYTFHETLRTLVMTLQAYRSATNMNYFRQAKELYGDFLVKAGRFLIACTRPDMTFERLGDTSPNRATANVTVPLTIEALASGLGDAAEAARLRSFGDDLRAVYGENALHPWFDWGMRAFFDPDAPRTPPYRSLPQAMRLGKGTYEHIMLRNGWGPDSTLITIVAGDHFTDHQHFDKGHFLVYRRGGLAVDGGGYDGMYKPGGHPNEYGQRTVAHNCVLVYDPEQTFPDGYGNDGGQNVLRGLQHHGDWPLYVAHRKREGLDTADVLAFDHVTDRYAYVRADLTSAYSSKVHYYDRQFVYLPQPDVLVVFDRVTASREGFAKRWLLHFQDAPSVDGRTPAPGVTECRNPRLIRVERRGQSALGGDPVLYDGVLWVRTLLPAERTAAIIGGPGFEYYDAFRGRNYPPSRPGVVSEPREAGRWRLEVAPAESSRESRFLHVLEMAAGPAREPAGARRLSDETGKLTGALIASGAAEYAVLFAAGQHGGPVKLPVRYKLEPAAGVSHLLVEMRPNQRVSVHINGMHRLNETVNAEGVLFFETPEKAPFEVVIRAEQ